MAPERETHLPVWCGARLGTWLRLLALRPPIHWSRVGRLTALTIAGVLNSMLHVTESACYGRRINRVVLSKPPLFILGHWRSGTTLLHNLLARDSQFIAPTHYQVSFPGHFLLTENLLSRLTAPLLPTKRPMDDVALGWELPGEDEIALLLTTLLSPYLRVAFPNGGPQIDRLDDLQRNLSPAELRRWKQELLYFLKKITLRHPKTPLLKSPAHTARIPLLLELFPTAKFVYIVRNPYDVFPSTRNLYQVLSSANSFAHADPVDLDERILIGYQRLYDAYHLHRALIPPNRRHEMRFEDLVATPLEVLKALYASLDLNDFDAFRLVIEPELDRLRSHPKGVYQVDELTKERVRERWGPAFRRYGYAI